MNLQKIQARLELLIANKQEEQDQALRQALYEELFEMIYALAKNRCPTDAEDVVHDFFVDKLFRVSTQKLAVIIDYMEPFIIRSVLNYCYTHSARKRRRQQLLEKSEYAQSISEDSKYYFNPVDELHFSMDLDAALKIIPHRQRTAFLLHYKEGYKYKEFAEVMEDSISAGAAKQLVNRAKAGMRQMLKAG